MNVKLLIQQAYRWAEILAEDGQYADSTQLQTGLNIFNKILRRISIDGHEIPLITREAFTLTAGVSKIELEAWVKLLKVQYNLGSIRADIKLISLEDFRNAARVTNTTGIPYLGYAQRSPINNTFGIVLNLFFNPTSNYEIFVDGYKSLGNVTLETDLTGIEEFMQDYLEIQLAYDLQAFYQLSPSPYLVGQLEMYLDKFKNIKTKNINIMTSNYNTDDMIYTDTPFLNLGGGWTP